MVSDYISSKEGKKVNYGLIKANQEKSKHLETAVIRVHGVFIDFVNLRADKYAEDSMTKFGSPREDAFRRDFTINSLFYNVNLGIVEDWT